ncbi:MAG TPA: hydroxyethylthiazole kinase [Thermoplasmata archaeon]|nr:hydroxyethylthiazole kinase [Thermoplasmata archaeon]
MYETIERMRRDRPLVHHITNWVTIYDCAQSVRAIGALPVMAHARDDALEMVGLASAVVLNIGTLTGELVDTMVAVAERARERGVPVVLDPVGAGATIMRTEAARRILHTGAVTVLKGNAGEVTIMAGGRAEVRGVESMTADGAVSSAAALARDGPVVVITGATDTVTDADRTVVVSNGTEVMGRVVGTGCMAASVIGAFVAVDPDPLEATVNALAAFGIAGEKAAEHATGPMAFKHRLMDELASLSRADVARARVER